MPRLETLMKIVRVLERAEEIKETSTYCRARLRGPMGEYCECKHGELCQQALSEVTGISKIVLSRVFRNLEFRESRNPFVIREIQNPKNAPRKFIKLKENYLEILLGREV